MSTLLKETTRLFNCRDCGEPKELHRNPKGRFSRRLLCHACAADIHAAQGRIASLRVSKPDGGMVGVVTLGGRPRVAVDLEKVKELSAQGWGYKAIATRLTRQGQVVSPATIRRRLKGEGQ